MTSYLLSIVTMYLVLFLRYSKIMVNFNQLHLYLMPPLGVTPLKICQHLCGIVCMIKCDYLYSCAAVDKISTDTVRRTTHGLFAIAGLLILFIK